MFDYEGSKFTLKNVADSPCFIFPAGLSNSFLYTIEDIEKMRALVSQFKLSIFELIISQIPHKDTNFKNRGFAIQQECEDCSSLFVSFFNRKEFISYIVKRQNLKCPICSKKENITKEDEKLSIVLSKARIEKLSFSTQKGEDIKKYIFGKNIWKVSDNIEEKIEEIKKHIDNPESIAILKNISYSEFLKSPYWSAISQYKKKLVGNKCELCLSADDLQVHHKKYYILGEELKHLDKLLVVCKNCHKRIHDGKEDTLNKIGTDFSQRLWINRVKRIYNHLQSEGCKLFLPIMNELSLSERHIPKEPIFYVELNGDRKIPFIIKPDIKRIAKNLQISHQWVYRYLNAIEKNGFVIRIGEKGQGKVLYYSIGTEVRFQRGNRWKKKVLYFLKDTKENRKKLLDFKV